MQHQFELIAAMNSTEAYEHCESLTRRAAANFYYGIRLLPSEKRQATAPSTPSREGSTTLATGRSIGPES